MLRDGCGKMVDICWTVLLALVLLLPRAAVAQGCQVPPDLMAVARALAALPDGGTTLAPEQAARLALQMQDLSEARILTQLDEAGLDSVTTVAVDLLAEAERLGDGAAYNPSRLHGLLTDLDHQSTLACTAGGESIFQRSQNGRAGGRFEESGFSWSDLEKKATEEKLFAAGAVVAAMAGFISVLFLIDAGYRWVMALLYNRKACRIPCNLTVGGHVVEGLILTLGKGGCRYHPLNVVAFDDVLPDLRGSVAVLRIEESELQARSSGIYDTVTDFRFDRPITIKQQKALLEHSTISPYYIRKSRDGGQRATEQLLE